MIIADTGFWLALANRRDAYHERATTKLHQVQEPLITTWPVLTETCHILLNRLGTHAQNTFMESCGNDAFRVYQLERADVSRISSLFVQYQDLPMDLADASLIILAEHLGHGRILSTDERDFHTYRWKQHEPFENLLLT